MLLLKRSKADTCLQETHGRTLEELAFLFEDKALADQSVNAVEKQLHAEGYEVERDMYEVERDMNMDDKKQAVTYVEAVPSREIS